VSRAERTLQKLQREGRLDPAIDPHYAATALTSMVGGFARTWFITGEEFELENAGDSADSALGQCNRT